MKQSNFFLLGSIFFLIPFVLGFFGIVNVLLAVILIIIGGIVFIVSYFIEEHEQKRN